MPAIGFLKWFNERIWKENKKNIRALSARGSPFHAKNGDEGNDTGKQENQTAPDSHCVSWGVAFDERVSDVTLNPKKVRRLHKTNWLKMCLSCTRLTCKAILTAPRTMLILPKILMWKRLESMAKCSDVGDRLKSVRLGHFYRPSQRYLIERTKWWLHGIPTIMDLGQRCTHLSPTEMGCELQVKPLCALSLGILILSEETHGNWYWKLFSSSASFYLFLNPLIKPTLMDLPAYDELNYAIIL